MARVGFFFGGKKTGEQTCFLLATETLSSIESAAFGEGQERPRRSQVCGGMAGVGLEPPQSAHGVYLVFIKTSVCRRTQLHFDKGPNKLVVNTKRGMTYQWFYYPTKKHGDKTPAVSTQLRTQIAANDWCCWRRLSALCFRRCWPLLLCWLSLY